MRLFDLTGKKAIVTGGSRGLGRGMAEALLEAGAETVIIGVSDNVFETAQQFKADGHKAEAIQGNLANKREINLIFEAALEKLAGRIDILVNAAGVQRRNRCEDFSLEDWEDVLDVNLTALFLLCQCAGRAMLARGKGKIINVASMLSFFGGLTVPAYAASKGAVAQLTKALANEWASQGINVNAIAPGYMATDMNTNLINDEKRNSEILARIPQARWGRADDMKGVTIFLSSEASAYFNGAIIPVDGGYLAR